MMGKRLIASVLLWAITAVMACAAMNCRDSIRTLVDLYDLTLAENPQRADSIAEIAYRLALSHGDTIVASSMLASRADINANNRDTLNMLLMRAESISKCRSTEEDLLFIKMIINSWYRNNALESERLRWFASEFRRYTLEPPENLNDKLILLHSVCVSLPLYLNTKSVYDNLGELRALVERKPENYYKVRVMLCRCEALAYYFLGDKKRAISADLRLLREMDSIQAKMNHSGRYHFQLNYSRFKAYTRLLSNFANLSASEISEYHNQAHVYLNQSARAQREFDLAPMADIYYYMSLKNYHAAAPLLDKALNVVMIKQERASLLRFRIECAKYLNEDEILHSSSEEYITLLESRLQTNMSENDRGRRAVYEAFVARDELNRFEAEQRDSLLHEQRVMAFILIVAMTVMFVILIIIWHQKIRRQRLARQLLQANRDLQIELERTKCAVEALTAECQAAQASSAVKDDFLQHLAEELSAPFWSIVEHSHLIVDCCDNENHRYLAEYVSAIESNGALITALLEDIKRIKALEDRSALLLHRAVDVCYLISLAADSVCATNSLINIKLDLPAEQLQVLSDPGRLQQIISNTLQCIAQLEPHSIVISARKYDDNAGVVIDIEALSDKLVNYNVFEGPTRVDGMLYTRLLVHLLGGDIMLDSTHSIGLHLVINLPIA